jgi:predicted membrane protein
MTDLVFWGIFTILGTSVAAIIVVLGIYFLLTKGKKESKAKESYTLDKQKEVK